MAKNLLSLFIVSLMMFALSGCASQGLRSDTKFKNISNIPAPRAGPVYMSLYGAGSSEIQELIDKSGYITTKPQPGQSSPAFTVNVDQSKSYKADESSFLWQALTWTIWPLSTKFPEDWNIEIKDKNGMHVYTDDYNFYRTHYISIFPHVYLFGKKAGKGSGYMSETVTEAINARVVSNIIYQANQKGLLDTNK